MKRFSLLFTFVLAAATLMQAQGNWSFKGTVVKMQMADCPSQHHFMTTMSGVAAAPGTTCPAYTIMSDKVVYVVVARRAEAFIPLAESIDFLIRKNELVTFSDNEKTKSEFLIQQMVLRADWDKEEARKELADRMMERSTTYEIRNPPHTSMVSTSVPPR